MKKAFLLFFLLGLSSYLAPFACAQETITLETYYPAPFGAYDRVRLVPRATLNLPCQIGTMYVSNVAPNNGKLRYCFDNGAGVGVWGYTAGVWEQNVNSIYPSDTASNPNLNVGIGIINPTEKLVVLGGLSVMGPTAVAKGILLNINATGANIGAEAGKYLRLGGGGTFSLELPAAAPGGVNILSGKLTTAGGATGGLVISATTTSTPAVGKVLTSDATGNATWQNPTATYAP